MKGLPYILFLIRTAGPVGVPHAQALARMLREEGDIETAEKVEDAIRTPYSEREKEAMMTSEGVEPS